MGIPGLLQLLKPTMTDIHVKRMAGKRVAVDAYVWLHRGTFSCALEIAQGKDTQNYTRYCMRKVAMLKSFGVIPVMVFDGSPLPSKQGTEATRQASRAKHKAKGLGLLRAGKRGEAIESFQKAVDVTPEMAKRVIDACKAEGVEVIVAPYVYDEASGCGSSRLLTLLCVADSDLIVFGCRRVIYKLNENGDGSLYDRRFLGARLGQSKVCLSGWCFAKIRQMCILSGCDYLPSIPGVGLTTAYKLLRDYGDAEKVIKTLRRTGAYEVRDLVPENYEQLFVQAEQTFLFQLIWDLNLSKITPLTPYPESVNPGDLHFAGPAVEHDKAVAIVTGDLNPITGMPLSDIPTICLVTNLPATSSPATSGLPQKNTMTRYLTVSKHASRKSPNDTPDDEPKEPGRSHSAPPFESGRSRVLTKSNSGGGFHGAPRAIRSTSSIPAPGSSTGVPQTVSGLPKPRKTSKFFSAPKRIGGLGTSDPPRHGQSSGTAVAATSRRTLGLVRPVQKRKALDLSQFSANTVGVSVAPLALRAANVLPTPTSPPEEGGSPVKRSRSQVANVVPVSDLASRFGRPKAS